MKYNTKICGEIEIREDSVITFEKGIIGFADLKHFVLIHDEKSENKNGIRFLQSLDEPGFAMPVIDPLMVKADYNPQVEDELLKCVGNLTPDNLLVLVTLSVPSDLTKMTANLQGPFIINVDERKACQIILDSEEYPVKYPIYDILQARKGGE